MPADIPINQLRNLGSASAEILNAVGIHTKADLSAIGAAAAYRRAKSVFGNRVSLNLLWAMQGALMDLPWNALPEEIMAELRTQID